MKKISLNDSNLLLVTLEDQKNLCGGPLWNYLRILWDSSGNLNAYHGIIHTLSVLTKCYSALSYYDDGEIKHPRELMISAMIHDRNHIGKKQLDHLNIEVALSGIESFIFEIKDDVNYIVIEELVRSTEFSPVGHVVKAVTEEQKILRDADVTQGQVFDATSFGLILFGLAKEAGISPTEMLKGQEKFLSSFKPASVWGKSVFTPELINSNVTAFAKLEKSLS